MQINLKNTKEFGSINNINNENNLYGTYTANKEYNSYGYKVGSDFNNGTTQKTNEINMSAKVLLGANVTDRSNTSDLYSKSLQNDKADSNLINSNEQLISKMTEAVNQLKDMITPEGYNALSELGIIPDEENPELMIGVCERIQMQLAAYCEDYKPIGLNIDKAKMKEILGSEVFAQSVEKAMDVAYMSDESKAAVVKGVSKLTIDEVYKHAHSVGSADKATDNINDKANKAFDEIKTQVEKIFDKMGIEVNEYNMNQARWMHSHNIPLTEENILKTLKLEEMLSLPKESLESVIKENISLSMYFTAGTKNALFTKDQYDIENVSDAIDVLNKTEDVHVEQLIKEGKNINIQNLKMALTTSDVISKEARQFSIAVTTKSVILTARVMLTSTVLIRMQEVGIDINITSLSEMIDIEKANLNMLANGYLEMADGKINTMEMNNEGMSKAAELFNKSLYVTNYVKESSVAMISKITVDDTFDKIFDAAQATSMDEVAGKISISQTEVKEYQYELTNNGIKANSYIAAKALVTYDIVGTMVRRDLGDTYTKAFKNIDELLLSIGVDKNNSTTRAARILGYNEMEITKENIMKVEEVANELDYLIENMTPKTVSYLIANDINPFNLKLKDLNEELTRINAELGITNNEDYAEYLWKLDKAGEIDKEAREKYISIYKTIKSIAKKDGRALGAALLSNYELTLDNILTAERNRKYAGEMDTADKDMQYMKFKTDMIKDIGNVSKEEVTELVNHNIDVNLKNIKTLKELKDGNKAFAKLKETSSDKLKTILDELDDESLQRFDSEENLRNTIEALKMAAEEELEKARETEMPTYKNISEALENFGLINMMSAYSKYSSYYVPVTIGGEVTRINLTIKNNENISKVSTYIKESVYGKISLEITISQKSIKGIMVVEDSEKLEIFNGILEKYTKSLTSMLEEGNDKKTSEIETVDIKLLNNQDSNNGTLNYNITETLETNNSINYIEGINRKLLFESAKLFIETIKTYEI